jgi:hypothetical protein
VPTERLISKPEKSGLNAEYAEEGRREEKPNCATELEARHLGDLPESK